MPFSPLIGISFLLHLVFALLDVAVSAWERSRFEQWESRISSVSNRTAEDGKPCYESTPVFLPDTNQYETFLLGKNPLNS